MRYIADCELSTNKPKTSLHSFLDYAFGSRRRNQSSSSMSRPPRSPDRHPFSVDFVEEGATLDSTGRRLAEISSTLKSIRERWDSRAIALARFNVSASSADDAESATQI